ncbi:hypothetical protein H6P81_002514 [Aristolochia fimbriata]|uniref:Essential protein Yae1 N-terminal domain-containing protein n=1 Tax=Aristolochia fimbriata TaxID=158543 RepID=A0AAV7FD67_ARIFI|nr:hypothetical protein H6P81_002514 [Aristolochia fimbriata]
MESTNLEDIFDSALNLEEKHFDEGFKDGFADGLVIGKQEGREVGLKHGFEVGEELGFYKGCVDVWTSVIHVNSDSFSARVQNNIKQMKKLIDKYPLLDPENENVQEIMEALRLKYRAITATLGVKLDYNGYPNSADEKKCDWRRLVSNLPPQASSDDSSTESSSEENDSNHTHPQR